MNERIVVARNSDMAFPEHQVAKLQSLEACRRAKRPLLHVAVARAGEAGCRKRHLHQSGAVDAEAGLAAPEIRHTDKTLGDLDEIRLDRAQRNEVLLRYIATEA